MQLELMTEESLGLMQQFIQSAKREFWIEGSSSVYRIHLRTFVKVNSLDEYENLIRLSSAGRNDAVKGVNLRIIEAVVVGREKLLSRKKPQKEPFEWQLSKEKLEEGEIGKSILGKLADDIRVCVTEEWVELIVVKKTPNA